MVWQPFGSGTLGAMEELVGDSRPPNITAAQAGLDTTTPEFKQAIAAAMQKMNGTTPTPTQPVLDTTTPEFKEAIKQYNLTHNADLVTGPTGGEMYTRLPNDNQYDFIRNALDNATHGDWRYDVDTRVQDMGRDWADGWNDTMIWDGTQWVTRGTGTPPIDTTDTIDTTTTTTTDGTGTGTYPWMPQPEGGPVVPWEPGTNVDTSWNWDYFKPKAPGDGQWGGYDQDYQAFERYQPGMESPWGMTDIEGGNTDFYRQQFVNMLRDEQGYRNRQREAQRIRQEALENPYTPPPQDEMWSWAYGGQGLPSPGTGNTGTGGTGGTGGGPPPSGNGGSGWEAMTQLNPFYGFTPETTNQEIFNQLIDTLDFSNKDVNWLQQWANEGNWPVDSTTWANAGNYLDLKSSFDLTGYNATNRDRIKTLLQNIYVAPTTTGGTQ